MKKLITILSLLLMSSTVFANQYEGIYSCFSDREFQNNLNVSFQIKQSQTFLNGSFYDLLANRTLVMHSSTVIGGNLDMVILKKVAVNTGNIEDIKFCKLQKANGILYPSGTFVPAGH
ncbi:MAG: hypothetical protein A2622_13750 [Bdellovibrionales bacterium RIFCSPHIGHO2_01_FULL_40_29]|nr:MAG: hypothetical protein A2622_13750 [Bdellovibrionales bacterium RIFCSPHIGHO2_01_FULL_40_29]OFZ35215.1 MAG: hypothetical protein A3D17_14400 [Bdellovibrionales bacterium RIFCSPHIGHO2_02_FULL_40_15]